MIPSARRVQLGEPFLEFLSTNSEINLDEPQLKGLERPEGGSSWETLFVTIVGESTTDETTTMRLVLRAAPDDGPLAPYQVETEFEVLRALDQCGMRVARPIAVCGDPTVIGRPFMLSAYVEGEAPDLSKIERWPLWLTDRNALGAEMLDVLAEIQAVRWQETSLRTVLGSGDARHRVSQALDTYAERNLVRAGLATSEPIWQDALCWLRESIPDLPESELVLVHGDFRFGNFIWTDVRVQAVLDWELAMIGDPMQDLGFMCMPFARRRTPELMAMVLPLNVLRSRYEQATGRAIDMRRLHYYAVFWTVLHGIFATTMMATIDRSLCAVSSVPLISPTLLALDALRLITDHERERYDV